MTSSLLSDNVALFAPHGKSTKLFSLAGIETLARVVSVYDGDSFTAVLPYAGGFWSFKIRLAGIDTCELMSKDPVNKKLADQARKFLCSLIGCSGGRNEDFERDVHLVRLKCGEFDKYGRLLARVYEPFLSDTSSCSFSQRLFGKRLAYVYNGDKKLTEAEQVQILMA
jgi:endonuclease YncB( thermonuclease family)